MISGAEALARLREGNRRSVAGVDDPNAALRQTHRLALAQGQGRGQEPFAIVLGCSDSRVPAELVFGQGFGDLFVIRVAGNLVCRLLLEKKNGKSRISPVALTTTPRNLAPTQYNAVSRALNPAACRHTAV